MVNKEHLRLRFLLVAFFLLLAVMIFAGLYPFNFFPPNRVRWVSNEPGLYFDGAGIAYTDTAESISLKKAVSVELLLKERRGSKNWGPKEIFSLYDGAASPSLLVGQWAGRIFIYSRFEKNEGHKWYRLFRTKHRFPRGKAHLVTVTFDESEKAIYIDGQLSNRKNVELNDRTHIEFSESFLLGNSHRGKNGWWGEIKGLAVYNRILLPDEIVTHSRKVFQKGVSGLAETPGCLALYPFDEGEGNTAKSILGKPRPFSFPVSLNALGVTILSLPHKDMRFYFFYEADFLKNIVFFVLFGILLTAIILKKYATGYFATFLIVTLTGGLLSCVIEGLQLFLPTRVPGMADISGNILGSGLGMLVTFIILKEKS
ncbi:MAG: VanZ family protein [Thermodesulfobacteriota bacterium]|nr:VanZ family protein [Thermodesulfobacteriota bacterium]